MVERDSPRKRIRQLAILLVLFVGPGNAAAGERSDNGTTDWERATRRSSPVWTVLIPAATASGAVALFEELSLVSMGVEVTSTEVPCGFFTEAATRRHTIEAAGEGADAVLWLSPDDPDTLFIYITAVGEGSRAAVPISADTVAALALAAREYLEARRGAPIPVAHEVTPSAREGRQMTDSETPWQPEAPEPPSWYRKDLGMGVLLQGGGGFYGGSGADVWTAGAGFYFRWRPLTLFALRLFVAGGLGPVHDTGTVSLMGKWIEPGVAAGFEGRVKAVRLGPVVSVSGLFSSLTLKQDDPFTEDQEVNNWNLKGGAGMRVSLPVHEGCRVGLDAGIEALLFRYHYEETRFRQEIIVTPTLSWKAVLTAVFFFPNRER